MNKPNIIKTERLILKSITDNDYINLISMLTNEEVIKTYMVPNLETEEVKLKMFNRFKTLSESNDHFVYGIYYNDRLIGFMNDVEIVNNEIEVGFVIDPEFKNNGFATESLKAAINELFKIGFKTVKTGVFIENLASARVMIKSGMIKVDRDEVVEYRGEDKHCYCFEIYSN